jgi:hypothetical protein
VDRRRRPGAGRRHRAGRRRSGEQGRGNIGDRDHLRYLDRDYDLVEAQGRRGDFGSRQAYLYDRTAGTAERLDIVTHGGSTAFANPTATVLRDPASRDAVMVTLFLPTEGAAPGRGRLPALPSPSRRNGSASLSTGERPSTSLPPTTRDHAPDLTSVDHATNSRSTEMRWSGAT